MSADDQISLRQIRYFIAVCEQGTVSGAAAAMNISQPALGMQIRQLEEALGVRLFDRSAQGLTPTDAGLTFRKSARKLLAVLKDAQRELTARAGATDVNVMLGMTTTSGNELAASLLKAAGAHSRNRRYRLSFCEGKSDELLALLRDRKIDAALSYEDSAKTSYDVTPLYEEEFVLVGTPKSLKGLSGAVPLDDVRSLPLVVSPAEQGSRRFLRQVAAERGTSLNIDVEMSAIGMKQQMMLHHDKCMIVPAARFRREVERGQLAMLRFRPALSRTMKLFLRKSVEPHIREFLKKAVVNSVKQRMKDGQLGWSNPS